jgi:hypothetical protein
MSWVGVRHLRFAVTRVFLSACPVCWDGCNMRDCVMVLCSLRMQFLWFFYPWRSAAEIHVRCLGWCSQMRNG